MECQGCKWGIVNLTLMCQDEVKFQTFLRSHAVLRENIQCINCGNEASKSLDGFWRCQRRHKSTKKKGFIKSRCNFKMSVKSGSIFSRSHLPLQKLCLFFVSYLTLPPPRRQLLMQELNISIATYIRWSSFCREVCISWSEENCTMLGGEGKIVEIDEAKFGKRKYHRGRLIEGQWVLGGVERGSDKCFYVPVPARDAKTLTEIILQWILPETTIISDCWKAYSKLGQMSFTHLTVNHSLNFVDPETGGHTQNIERSWRDARGLIPRYGRSNGNFEGYLAEFLFKRFHKDPQGRIHEFLKVAVRLVPGFNALE